LTARVNPHKVQVDLVEISHTGYNFDIADDKRTGHVRTVQAQSAAD